MSSSVVPAAALEPAGVNGRRAAGVALILAALAAVYLLVNLGPAQGGFTETYVVQPLLWAALAAMVVFLYRTASPPAISMPLAFLALLAAAFHLTVLLMGGVLSGFGYSPYSHGPSDIVTNLAHAMSALIAMELARAYLVRVLGPGRPLVTLGFTALLFTVVGLPLAQITGLQGGAATTRFVGDSALPLLAENLLASYLAALGGPLAALAYRMPLESFEWLSPALPALPWAGQAFLGTIAPVLAFLGVHSAYGEEEAATAEGPAQTKTGKAGAISWTLVSILGVGILWFSIGIFGVQPAIVTGDSMVPALREGDLIVVKPVTPDEIEVGDLIRYENQGLFIVHRVVEIEQSGDSIVLVTRGDSNASTDPPVVADQVVGKVFLDVPKVGKVGLLIKQLIAGIIGGG